MARVLPYGARAWLVEAADADGALGLHRAVLASDLPVVESVPAARSVLVRFASERDCAGARTRLERLEAVVVESVSRTVVTIPVLYDGADLAEVARLTGLAERAVVARHTGGDYVVGFVGFAPGFAYLLGLDPRLHVPRLDSPRTAVPAGSVAIAGPYAAIYPTASPGGWRLLGRTATTVFDVEREPPALLAPGPRVRFTEVCA